MIDHAKLSALRMERQHLTDKANETEYKELYRDLSPGHNVYWNGFGDPPTLTYRTDFNDMDYNRARQAERSLVKLRLAGGNLGWVRVDDLELFACAYVKPLDKPSERHVALLELINREGPLTIQLMKEFTGMLIKEITLHYIDYKRHFLSTKIRTKDRMTVAGTNLMRCSQMST